MNGDRDTVEVTVYECESCGTTVTPSYHDGDDCEAPVLSIGGEWRCSGCGASIAVTGTCVECGSGTTPSRLAVPLDLGPPVDPGRVERYVHVLTNEYRSEQRLPTLAYNDHLGGIALHHSRDMAVNEYFDHTAPDGSDTVDRYRTHDHSDRSAGENIALRQPGPTTSARELAESIVDGWMNSTGHRENILRERFDAEGVGVYVAGDGTVYATQNFR